ncbi:MULTISPECIES: phosphodiester glycosidase family protein [Proteiniphilum]|uniref:phosphodiester glycosidase family protein n=1 Tax=Proteiniphilum TaxID=294702 RepID=UPI001EEA16AB|nr:MULTISPECIES: phosphodiester glycosidase family protein [Proteiniphilum]ULB34893.1 phosphodiester glycosidase family protein [Proteiniphilum propionicum]
MRHIFFRIAILSLLLLNCSDKNKENEFDFRYITKLEVLSHKALDVKIDNFRKTIDLLFESGQDFSQVEIRLTLANNVEMVAPQTATAIYDLTNKTEISVKRNGEVTTFIVNLRYKSIPFVISSNNWEKKDNFGNLPEYLSIYKYKKDISGKLVQAYIAVADVSEGKAKFKILGEKKGYHTPTQFYEANSFPKVVLNGGFFWSGTSLGLIIKNGETVSKIETVTTRKYNGVDTNYYPTTGAFGMESDGTFTSQWVYHSNNILYAYPSPSPNKSGEKPMPIPSAIFPEGAVKWQPKEAISAGPLLIKEGEYKNLWENELFDEASGVGPNYNHPRSAVGYHPNGYVVLFVCEGRNKTPNTPGMTLKNVADILLELGCTEAINLDGGGSSCMLINGKETIIPSDGKQRTITNMVAIY